MFRIVSLTLYPTDAQLDPYTYLFDAGINYFRGKNDSGKTEFYLFLDYMFGANEDIQNKEWYRDSLDHAKMIFVKDELTYALERYIKSSDKNYFYYADEPPKEPIRSNEYRARLNQVFAQDQVALKELRAFVEEDVTYRTFTLFNFLGETRQGILNDFWDKADKMRYALRLPSIINYVFNKNLARIKELKSQEERLKKQINNYEKISAQNDEARLYINTQLKILGIGKIFTGQNARDILRLIDSFQSEIKNSEIINKGVTITELEAVYTSLDEQIKRQERIEKDHRAFESDSRKQILLLDKLHAIIDSEASYRYLAEPIVKLTEELNRSISFNKYFIQENTTKELKKQRDSVRNQILSTQSCYKIYSVSDKTRAITLIREYLGRYQEDIESTDISAVRRELREVREELRALQNSNDTQKISSISNEITRLYKQSIDVSDLSEFDFQNQGFQISYIKHGNVLQPQIDSDNDSDKSKRNYYTGSMARRTLIQLCGYIAFLKLLITESRYPLIPILIIDHISKTFDKKNAMAIGKVIHGAYDGISTSDLQIIIFDDEENTSLAITPARATELVSEHKSGFNPYYYKESSSLKSSVTTPNP